MTGDAFDNVRTIDDFIAAWCGARGTTYDEMQRQGRVARPCECGDPICTGFVMDYDPDRDERDPGSVAWHERLDGLILAENEHPEHWWYLSFADASGFLGACVVRGSGIITAVARTNELDINPGGEVAGVELAHDAKFPDGWCDRLLDREEATRGPWA